MNDAGLRATLTHALDLKPFPKAAQDALVLVMSRDWRVDAVERVISTDPGLAARVLRMANSPLMAPPRPVDSIRRGLVVLGSKAARDLLVLAALQGMFDDPRGADVLEHCAGVSAAIRTMEDLGLEVPDGLSAAGLLHDVGILLLLQTGTRVPDALEGPDRAHPREVEELGFDHAALGAYAVRAWGIPAPVPGLVAWHHSPLRAQERGGSTARAIGLLRTADALEHLLARHEEHEGLEALVGELSMDELLRLWRVLAPRRGPSKRLGPRAFCWR